MDDHESLLSRETLLEVERIGTADIIVGIPSSNDPTATVDVLPIVTAALMQHFSGARSVIVSPDGGSIDGPPSMGQAAGGLTDQPTQLSRPTAGTPWVITPHYRLARNETALRMLCIVAQSLQARACTMIDSESRSITSEGIELLIRPILEDKFDFVAPVYRRHKYDGTITNSIVYPLTRALYGRRVRQPSGGDFGFSGRLGARYLGKGMWVSDIAQSSIQTWMTTTALAEGFRVCQVFLGDRVHDTRAPRADLSAMLRQVVGTVFALMETYETAWQNVTSSSPVPLFGKEVELWLEPLQINVERMVNAMRLGMRDLLPLWEQVLAKDTMDDLYQLEGVRDQVFQFPQDLWVRVIYDFALGYHYRVLHRDHLLAALAPLYLGQVASFILETREGDATVVEGRIEALCRRFETIKPYLAEQWRQSP